jgi:hypothetical protein
MGLEASAVEVVMRLMKVSDRLECFDKVRLVAAKVAGYLAKEAEKQRENS